MASEPASEIDEGLYSRQLYVMGREGQAKMAASNVLIVGLNGLGVEIAKNVILAGVKSVTLWDPTPTTWLDLSAQFYLSESDLGAPRAQASVARLAELNPYVAVAARSGEALSVEFLGEFSTVVMVNAPLETQLEVNDLCHTSNICFVACEVGGVFGSVFCDFGDAHTVTDKNGEPNASCLVAAITQANPALVTVLDDTRHNLESGDCVTLDGAGGMEGTLTGRTFTVKVVDPYSFEIDCDTTAAGPYTTGGYMNQVKVPETMKFKPLRSSLADPGDFLLSDFAKFDHPPLLHAAFQGLHAWKAKHGGALPIPGDEQAALQVLEEAKKAAAQCSALGLGPDAFEGKGADLVKALSQTAAGVLGSMCALLGGVAGQEVLKASSGKFTPINQWFYFDAVECLPSPRPSAEQVTPMGCRYDSQLVVFGREVHARICDLRYFVVGAGAIGCEMVKNFALMGLGCGPEGQVIITDMDTIERSNLSRQFLFRSSDIGRSKAAAASSAALALNPNLNLTTHESRVGPETEGLFGDVFWEGIDGVANALDNIEARLYVDQRCLFYQKPLLESGTLGTKGNTQVVAPFLTENYGATRDPPEKSIPVCTLKNFPNQIEHTLQWARDWFEGGFKQTPEDANKFLNSSTEEFQASLQAQQNTKLDTLRRIRESLVASRPKNFDECIAHARLAFQESFHNSIAQLLHNFPVDQVTSTGQPFWSGSKRPPAPLDFDPADPDHLMWGPRGLASNACSLKACF
mmetsp:Transcript_10674/g.24911  ORF Transcript_10674/g.24911 Transcript_10674/m.24911 type:complete len:747 (+) Transcript_10674:167-2407(+)